jgi:hypothetical protein
MLRPTGRELIFEAATYYATRRGCSALAFHKHNAKKTGHQNECRSCKKMANKQ